MVSDLENRILVIGNGVCALNIARELLDSGKEVILASKEGSFRVEESDAKKIDPACIMPDTGILSCRGCAGDFTVLMERGGEKFSNKFSCIVIAEENEKKNQL
jgi:heterodisulfide reductase subunit A-like polyferredoxin